MTRRLALALLFASTTGLLHGQGLWNIRGAGMAYTVNAASRGLEALGVNPANLAYPEGHTVFFSLPTVDASVRLMIGLDTYKYYFTGVTDASGTRVAKVLDDQGKADLLSKIPDLGNNRVDAEIYLTGIVISLPTAGSLGISIVDRVGVQGLISKEFFSLTQGFATAGSTYDLSETDVSAWYYREINISYARKIPVSSSVLKNLYVGVGVKAILGYGVAFVDHNSARLQTVQDPFDPTQYFLQGNLDVQMNRSGIDLLNGKNAGGGFQLFPAPAGTGTGFDIGATADLSDGMTASLSVTDIGSITWRRNLRLSSSAGSINIADLLTDAGQKQLKDAFHTRDTVSGPFSTALPTKLRFGMLLDCAKSPMLSALPSRLILAVDYTQGFTSTFGNTITPRMSVAAEYRGLNWFPLRTGVSIGGNDVIRWALGFGFDFGTFAMNFATDNFGMVLTPRSLQKLSFGFGMGWKF